MSMSRFVFRSVVVATLIALTASLAVAQDNDQGGRRRGGFGRGGFGRGFGGGFGMSMLVAMPEVQKEIGLSEADAAKLAEDLQALRPPRGQNNFGDFQNLSEEERQKRFEDFRKQMEEVSKKSEDLIKTTLSDAQFQRLEQLQIQRQGAMALNNEDVAKKLKITDEQKDKLDKIAEENRPQRRRGGGDGNNAGEGGRPNFDPEAFRARIQKMNDDMLAVLTPDQKKQFEEMQGEKFEFPPMQFGRGRRGGRGNRPAAE
jgi:Spy/CpxP family protein refolding chaperone